MCEEVDIHLCDEVFIGANQPVFIIAEIGQNHQGDVAIAKEMIREAKSFGANCVKFQKSCLEEKFNGEALRERYESLNAWGETYGAHKRHLEFTDEQFFELRDYAAQIGILFSASAMDARSLRFLITMRPPFIKIGSGDANNFPLIEEAAKSHIPLIISTGMQTLETVKRIYSIVRQHHRRFVLMHCVSAYPAPLEALNMQLIPFYRREFADCLIGYSGHEIDYHITSMAVVLGAKVIERHFTLDKRWKGTDHKCSLEPHEFRLFVEQVRRIERALGGPHKTIAECERECRRKLGKTICSAVKLTAGMMITRDLISIKVARPLGGIDAEHLDKVLGRRINVDVEADMPINWQQLVV